MALVTLVAVIAVFFIGAVVHFKSNHGKRCLPPGVKQLPGPTGTVAAPM